MGWVSLPPKKAAKNIEKCGLDYNDGSVGVSRGGEEERRGGDEKREEEK